ncbi:MAG: ribosome maturation factor RimM, partial [Angustibacter sp.]
MLRLVARIGRAHGLRGEVTVALHTDEPELRFCSGTEFLCAVDGAEPSVESSLLLSSAREHSGTWLLGFEQISDRTAAEGLRGWRLYL